MTFGLIEQIRIKPGKAEEFIRVSNETFDQVPGNLLNYISVDSENPDIVWMSEIWKDKETYEAALNTPVVQKAVGITVPLIVEMITRVETIPSRDLSLA